MNPPSLHLIQNHLVCEGEQPVRHLEAERLGGPEIDHEVKFRGLLYRQVSRLLAFENAAGIDAGQAVRIGYARSVAHQATRHGELAQRIGCR